MKPLRFLPLVALATGSLLMLKLASLVLDGRGALTGTQVATAKSAKRTHGGEPPAGAPTEVDTAAAAGGENAPATDAAGKAESGSPAEVKAVEPAAAAGEGQAATPAAGSGTGGNDGKGEAKTGEKAGEKPNTPPKDMESVLDGEHRTKSEIALLESLARRREDIDKREQELDLRLNLMKAAEQRVDEKIGALKELQGKIETTVKQDNTQRSEQYKQLVGLYTSMKPKDAARIFDELDNDILLELMKEMKAQTMSAIFAAMNPAKTRALTIAIATQAKEKPAVGGKPADELPRIGQQ